MILLVNSPSIQVTEIVLKFFESGHTFMAADSFHAAVEKSMRQSPPLTFPEFSDAVSKAKTKVDVLDMGVHSFVQTTMNVTQYTLNKCKKRPYIDKIKQIIVRKGSLKLHYSNSVLDEDEIQSCVLFSTKQLRQVTAEGFKLEDTLITQTEPVGLDAARKDTLLGVICPLIREEQKVFWESLPVKQE